MVLMYLHQRIPTVNTDGCREGEKEGALRGYYLLQSRLSEYKLRQYKGSWELRVKCVGVPVVLSMNVGASAEGV